MKYTKIVIPEFVMEYMPSITVLTGDNIFSALLNQLEHKANEIVSKWVKSHEEELVKSEHSENPTRFVFGDGFKYYVASDDGEYFGERIEYEWFTPKYIQYLVKTKGQACKFNSLEARGDCPVEGMHWQKGGRFSVTNQY